jgi:hypothetical protein
MLALAWRQFRSQAAVALVALVAAAIVLAITGTGLAHLYDSTVSPCGTDRSCRAAAIGSLLEHDHLLQTLLNAAMLLVPALIAMFWGAPLIARELESGTFRLAWTQSVTRQRWLTVKLAVVGFASLGVAGLFTLMVGWWFSPIDRVSTNRFSPSVFDARDIVPIGYAAFALALGTAAGLLLRRTVPAMAISLGIFVGARLAVTYWIRPHLASPAHVSIAISSIQRFGFARTSSGVTFVVDGSPGTPNTLVLSSRIVDDAGHTASSERLHEFLTRECPRIAELSRPAGKFGPPDRTTVEACVAKLSAHFHELVAYQPASRFWTFQAYETAIFIGLAVALTGVCFWSIRRLG